jgi:MFS family permease
VTSKAMAPRAGRIFYGWFALAGAMLGIFVAGGAYMYSYGVLLPVVCQEFGWSRAAVGAGLSLGHLAFGLPSPLFGIMVARFGPRVNIVVGNALVALGLACVFLVQEIWHIYLLYIFMGLSAGTGGFVAGTTVANNWFIKKRSLAFGMFLASGSLAGFVFAPLTTALISSIGWRMSWVVLGGIVLVVASLIGGLILIRNRPEDMGQLPDGASSESLVETETAAPSGAGVGQAEWQVRSVLRMPVTWFICVFSASNTFIIGTINTHQVAYVQDLGFTPMTAAMTLSVLAVSGIIGSLGFGTLALRFNIRYLASTAFVIQLTALAILLTTRELTWLYVYAVLLGISHGVITTAVPTFVGAYYERDHYARVLGTILPLQFITHATAATAAGAIYDATNTYTLAFSILVIFSLTGLICAFLARRPELPQPND